MTKSSDVSTPEGSVIAAASTTISSSTAQKSRTNVTSAAAGWCGARMTKNPQRDSVCRITMKRPDRSSRSSLVKNSPSWWTVRKNQTRFRPRFALVSDLNRACQILGDSCLGPPTSGPANRRSNSLHWHRSQERGTPVRRAGIRKQTAAAAIIHTIFQRHSYLSAFMFCSLIPAKNRPHTSYWG